MLALHIFFLGVKFFHNVLVKVLSTYCMKSIEHGAKRKAEEVEPLQRKKERRELKPAKKKYCMI